MDVDNVDMDMDVKFEESHEGFVKKFPESNLTVNVHPLVVLNISEHWTRIGAQNGAPEQVFGALLGKRIENKLEILNSFELQYSKVDNKTVIDEQYFAIRSEQFKQIFVDLDFLGWYDTGEELPNENDIEVHKQLLQIKENIIFLKLQPTGCTPNVPLTIYESIQDVVSNDMAISFIKVTLGVVTDESERVVIDHVIGNAQTYGSDTNTTIQQLTLQYNAVKMLFDRLKFIKEYVKALRNTELPEDFEMLRRLNVITILMDKIETTGFSKELYAQFCEMGLITSLAVATTGLNAINQYLNKLQASQNT